MARKKKPIRKRVPKKPIRKRVPKKPIRKRVPKKPIRKRVPKKPILKRVTKKPIRKRVPKKPIRKRRKKKFKKKSVLSFVAKLWDIKETLFELIKNWNVTKVNGNEYPDDFGAIWLDVVQTLHEGRKRNSYQVKYLIDTNNNNNLFYFLL